MCNAFFNQNSHNCKSTTLISGQIRRLKNFYGVKFCNKDFVFCKMTKLLSKCCSLFKVFSEFHTPCAQYMQSILPRYLSEYAL